MFRKDPEAQKEWSPQVVQLCAERQRRIVADVWEALRPDGYLIYSTCTYNRTENEDNVAWICTRLGAEKCVVNIDPSWGILEQEGGYRFLPDRLKGEGFFFALLQKRGTAKRKQPKLTGAQKVATIKRQAWVTAPFGLFTKGDLIKALPVNEALEVVWLETVLRVKQSGVAVARVKGNDWVPEADLALSPIMCPDVFPVVEIDIDKGRRYLAREAITLTGAPLGYVAIQYEGSRLGFAKNVGFRINNLYPPERRIRMGH